MVECRHQHFWIANSAVYHTPPCTALEKATPAVEPHIFGFLYPSKEIRLLKLVTVTDTTKLSDGNLSLNLKKKMKQKGRKRHLFSGKLNVRGIWGENVQKQIAHDMQNI